jgi:dihydroorotate dehydrogenase
MATLGFWFVEIGTLRRLRNRATRKPRLFRLPQDNGIINRMGFNNGGMERAVERLKKRPKGLLWGEHWEEQGDAE